MFTQFSGTTSKTCVHRDNFCLIAAYLWACGSRFSNVNILVTVYVHILEKHVDIVIEDIKIRQDHLVILEAMISHLFGVTSSDCKKRQLCCLVVASIHIFTCGMVH
jgi:hypothetical protein